MAYRKGLSLALGFFLLDLGGQAAFFAFSMAIECMVWVICSFDVRACWWSILASASRMSHCVVFFRHFVLLLFAGVLLLHALLRFEPNFRFALFGS